MTTSLTIHPVSKIKETTFHQYTPKYIRSSHHPINYVLLGGRTSEAQAAAGKMKQCSRETLNRRERIDKRVEGVRSYLVSYLVTYEAMRLWVCFTKTSFRMRKGGWIHGCSFRQHFGSWNPGSNILILGSWYDDITSTKNLHLLIVVGPIFEYLWNLCDCLVAYPLFNVIWWAIADKLFFFTGVILYNLNFPHETQNNKYLNGAYEEDTDHLGL